MINEKEILAWVKRQVALIKECNSINTKDIQTAK
jgi:hypothetical protein